MTKLLEGVHWRRDMMAAPWVPQILDGTDDGLFGPGSAVWAVNGSLPSMIAGIRALLIQALHPGALAGVHDHSSYREDTVGRLNRTIQWVATTTFGDTATAGRAAGAVARRHEGVEGRYRDAAGRPAEYSARDPHLVRWVHLAFTEAFLGAHRIWGGRVPGGEDAYVAEWGRAGELLGVERPPTSVAGLRAELEAFDAELRVDERVREVVAYLRRPRLERGMSLVYPVLVAGAIASLPAHYRILLGLRRPRWPAVTANRVLLRLLGLVLGRTSPSERAAWIRAARLRAARPDGDGRVTSS